MAIVFPINIRDRHVTGVVITAIPRHEHKGSTVARKPPNQQQQIALHMDTTDLLQSSDKPDLVPTKKEVLTIVRQEFELNHLKPPELLQSIIGKPHLVPREEQLISTVGQEVWQNTRQLEGPKCTGAENYRSYADFSMVKGNALEEFSTPAPPLSDITDLLFGICKDITLHFLSYLDVKCLVALSQTAKSTLRLIAYVFPRSYHAWMQHENHAFLIDFTARAPDVLLQGGAIAAKARYGELFVRPLKSCKVEGFMERAGWRNGKVSHKTPSVTKVYAKLLLASMAHALEVLAVYSHLPDIKRSVRLLFSSCHVMVRKLTLDAINMRLKDLVPVEKRCRDLVIVAALIRSMQSSLKYHPRNPSVYPSTPFIPKSRKIVEEHSIKPSTKYLIYWSNVTAVVELLSSITGT